jgi:hypothetical protein
MKHKYGKYITQEAIYQYLDRLTGRVFKLLPLWEQDKKSFYSNHKTLIQELITAEKMVLYCGYYIELINKLECLTDIEEHKYIKKHIRECIDIIQTLKKKVGEWEIGSIG